MAIEETMQRMESLGSRIKDGTASQLEALEWLELTNNGNPVKEAAIQLLKNCTTTDYGDGYFDGFLEAQNLYQKDVDLSNYTRQNIMELADHAESNFNSRNNQN